MFAGASVQADRLLRWSAGGASITASLSLHVLQQDGAGGVAMPLLHHSPAIMGAALLPMTQNVLFIYGKTKRREF